ncbi:RNA methyltransferase [Silvimonas sp. JCM 19000]
MLPDRAARGIISPFSSLAPNPMDLIQSAQNPLYKLCHKLAENRRDRLKLGQTLLDGPHLVAAALDAGWPLERILISQSGLQRPEHQTLLARYGKDPALLDDALFATLTELPSATGLIALAHIPNAPALRHAGLCLWLDGVQDPGNVGAILRTAAAAGVQQVALSLHSADVWSPRVLRAGMGAHFALEIVERTDLLAAASQFNGRIAALMLDGAVDLYESDLRGDVALVMGAEGQGVSTELEAAATLRLKIPMQPGIESLNVGHAAAICLYERVRQSRV